MKSLNLPIRNALGGLGAFLLSFVLYYSYLQGEQIEKQGAEGYTRFAMPKLLYGKGVPEFHLKDTHGSVWTRENLLGSWTLLCFASPNCLVCKRQLAELAAVPVMGRHGKVVGVLSGRLLLGSYARYCADLTQSLGVQYPVLVDEGGKLSGQVIDTAQLPYLVLLDPQGRVKLVVDRYEPGRLKEQVAQIGGSQGIYVKANRKPFPHDSRLSERGKPVMLQALIHRGWTVITFAKAGCGACAQRTTLLARFASDNNFQNVLVYYTDKEASQGEAEHRPASLRHLASDELMSRFGVHSLPHTVVFYDGSLAYMEKEGDSETELWQILGAAHDGRVLTRGS